MISAFSFQHFSFSLVLCPESGYRYQLRPPTSDLCSPTSVVRCLDLSEEDPLPPTMQVGKKTYDEFKQPVVL